MDIKAKVGSRVKELREAKGMSQKDLAFAANLDRSYIAGIESGTRNVSIVNIAKIAIALEISVQGFFKADQFGNDNNQ